MKRILGCLLLALVALAAETPQELFEKGLVKERSEGNLKEAIQFFERAAETSGKDRALAAKALLEAGECHRKLGDAEARTIFERVIRDYADQKEAVEEARARVGSGAAGPTDNQPVTQRIWAAEEAAPDFLSAVSAQALPDGHHVVYTDWKTGNVAVRDLQTGESRLLTHDAGDHKAQDLLLSPDGKQVAYRWAGKVEAEPIRIVGVDGTHMRDVLVREYGIVLFAWSPDGKQIAASQYNSTDKTGAVILLSVANGAITRLKTTAWAAAKIGGFSPDGKFLVYSLPKSKPGVESGIFAVAVDGSRETKLVGEATGSSDPRWTPDGRGVVFLSDRSGTKGLWLVRVADGKPLGEPELLRPQVGSVDLKTFARDGSLYYGTNQLESDLYQIEIDAEGRPVSDALRIPNRPVGTNYEPEPSPDGKLLAFFRGTPGTSYLRPAALIVRSNVTGEETTLLTGVSADYSARGIRWYPDSRSLLLKELPTNGKTQFRRIDVKTGEARIVFEGDAGVWSHAELARDGRTLFYSSRMTSADPSLGPTIKGLIRRDLETGQEREIYRMESTQAGFYGMSLSPDGRRLAFMADVNGNRALMTMPEAGGEAKEIYRAPEVAGSQEGLHWYGACWTADGRFLLATRSVMTEKQQDELIAFPVDGGEPRVLAVMPQITNPSASPDGRHILFTGAQQRHELWLMRNFLTPLQAAR